MDHQKDEIVISGVGGFFPKSENLEKFKESLLSNESLLETRWKEGERGVSNKIGMCPSMEYFDTAFFGIHRQQATFMDPMQRLMLERTFEALVDAGVNPQDIRGKRVGVFMGSSIGENDNLFYESIVSGFGVTGHSRAMMPNRISYWLNLKGPSCAYDSNWINGIEVLQMGFEAVREGHCEAAIIGTANLALNSEISWLYHDMGLLSPDGSVKAFDAEATGYARSDGIIAMYIQRAVDAKRSYATIVGTSTQFNGHREGTLLDIDQPSMVSFLNEFYSKCGVDPRNVDLVECYGCAIKTVDEIELNAIDEVYCKNRKKPLMIGSVKTNTGHSEASSNLFSIAKVLVAMETGKIPATLQYGKPNPKIKGLANGNMEVVTTNKDWAGGYAAINGIGLLSSYAHCLLKVNPKVKKPIDDVLPRLVVASTRTETGIQEILDTIKGRPNLDVEYLGLIQELFSKSIAGHLYRGYSVLDKEGEIKREFEYHPGNKRQTWFVFSGMGSQWVGMGADLMQLPLFAHTIAKLHKVLEPHGVDLLKIITDKDPTMFDNILHSFVGIAAVQIALTDILKALGITPDGIIGHSVGELGCAYADGCLSAEQMIMCAYSRGKASLEAKLINGMMAAVGLGYNQIKTQLPEPIEVACHNSENSSTISGPKEDMEEFVKKLQDKGVFARLVNVANIAYHSRYIKPAAPFLLKYLQDVIPNPTKRSSKWISTSVTEDKWGSDLAQTSSAEYHTNNLLSSVLFEEGSKHIPKDSVVIEIAPHGLLQAILKKSMKTGCTNIPLTQRGSKNAIEFLLGAIGKMYLAGLDVNVAGVFPKIEYPVSRGTCGLAPLVHWEHGETWRTGLEDKLNYMVSVKDIQISITDEEFSHCAGHQLDERTLLPLSSYLTLLLDTLCVSKCAEITEVVFENIRFRNVIQIPKIGSIQFYGMIQKGSGDFEVISENEIVMTGRVKVPESTDKIFMETYDLKSGEETMKLSSGDFYNEFQHRGHSYSGCFKEVKSVTLTKEGSIATLPKKTTWQAYLEAMLQQQLFHKGERNQHVLLPTVIQSISLSIANLPSDDSVVSCAYDYSTGVCSISGLQICGLTTTPLPINLKPISFDAVDYVVLDNCVCENVEKMINYSIDLTMNNFNDLITNNIVITEIVRGNASMIESIKKVTAKYTQLQANITSVTDPKITIVSQTDPILLITDDEIQPETIKSVALSDAFALVRSTKSLLSYQEVTTVAQFTLGKTNYSLIRKSHNKEVKLVKITTPTLSANDITRDSLAWVSELKKEIANLKWNQVIYIVSNVRPTEGITNFIRGIRNNPAMKAIKYIFNLDKKSTEVKTSDLFYQKLFLKDNLLNIIKNGEVATYLSASVDFNKSISNDLQVSSNRIDDQNLICIGINGDDETLHSKSTGLGNVDYAAINKEGKRVLGLARLDKDTYNLVQDPILKWTVPESWSMEDACTIPHAYAIAYHCLIQTAKLEPGETVLIHAGCSGIGLAAISIASTWGCSVFTTVATDWQKAFLRKQFSCLRERNILSSENTSFEPHLLTATGGVGAQVILNTESDSMLHATVRCLADYGRFIQLGKLDNAQHNTIGMSIFLRNTCLTGVVPEELFNMSDSDKEHLRWLLQEGIDKYAVRPLHRRVVEHHDIANILNTLKQPSHIGKLLIKLSNNLVMNQLNVSRHNQYICESKSSYLVFGGDAETWIDLVEWLVFRGARKVVVCSDSKPQQITVIRRLSLLHSHYCAEISYVGNKARSKDTAAELISELYTLGPIQGVYVLPNSSTTATDIKSVQLIEAALRTTAPKALFVNFQPEVAGVSQNRVDAGFPTFNVEWDNGLEFTDVLFGLDDILSFRTNDVYIKNDRVSDIEIESAASLYKKLTLLLPITGKELLDQAEIAPKEPTLVQLPSAGPRQIRELPPVIIVPGLSGHDSIKHFIRELLYPAFYTHLPHSFVSIEKASVIFADKIRKLHPRGPYNIIGISTGGILAIEISKILQNAANTQVTLIDAAPDTIQSSLKHLGEGANNEVNLLNRVLNINNIDFLKNLGTLPDWNARLSASLERSQGSDDYKKTLRGALCLLKQNLEAVENYRPAGNLLTGDVHLIRPTGCSKLDNCGLDKYFKQSPQIFVATGDHLSILKTEQVIDEINEKVTVI